MNARGRSQFNYLDDEILSIHNQNQRLSNAKIAKQLLSNHQGEDISYDYLRQYIGVFLKRQQNPALAEECEKVGIDINSVGNYWYKGKHFSIHAKNAGPTYEDFREDLIEELKEYSPTFEKINREPVPDGHLLVIDPADIHIGKLCTAYESGDEYNIEIARMRTLRGVEGILQKTSGFNIDQILFIIGNDMLHTENGKTTTSGTPQDTDGMWYEAFLWAKQTIVDAIELLLPIADLHITYNPSNHDLMSGFFLADSIYSWFRNCENITFDFSISHRKYYRYHNTLIGTTHGDGAKWKDLPLLMAQESKQDWSDSDHRYWYVHHVHHKQVLSSKDLVGCTIESLRSPSGPDSWHHRNGYQHAPKGIDGFVISKKYGQIARISHLF
jgi:hypothetical protein